MFKGTPQFTRRRSKAINELPALVLPPVVNVLEAVLAEGAELAKPCAERMDAEVIAAVLKPKSCPKCGKTGRGLHFHIKACRGDVRGN
jgi:hypothetical protein